MARHHDQSRPKSLYRQLWELERGIASGSFEGRENLPAELPTYRLVKLGLSLNEIDDASALRCDKLLAIDEAVAKGQEAAQR